MIERGTFIQAPDRKPIKGPLIFLAGPIQGAKNWQRDAAELIYAVYPDVSVASPRRDVFTDVGFIYDEQVEWESYHLTKAGENGAVLFWLAREHEHDPERAYAQTTRFELGEWFDRHKKEGANVVVGIEEGFTGAKYIRKRASDETPGISIFDSLEDTCIAAINAIKPKPPIQNEK